MSRIVFLLVSIWISALQLVWAQHPTNAQRNGISYYQILEPDTVSTRKTLPTDIMDVDYRMAVGSTDSILYETFTQGSVVTIPINHPSFLPVFRQVHKNDKVTIVVSADSFYKYTMNQPLPPYIKKGDSIHFFFKVYDVMNEKEYAAKLYAKELEAVFHDSVEFANYVSRYNRLVRTKSGLCYVVSAYGTGKQPRKGNKVTVKYKAYKFDGKVFERNDSGFTFTLGKKEVIEGWEEALLLMKEGARYKFIIPQHLAYGGNGSDAVPAFTSIVFDIELLKVE